MLYWSFGLICRTDKNWVWDWRPKEMGEMMMSYGVASLLMCGWLWLAADWLMQLCDWPREGPVEQRSATSDPGLNRAGSPASRGCQGSRDVTQTAESTRPGRTRFRRGGTSSRTARQRCGMWSKCRRHKLTLLTHALCSSSVIQCWNQRTYSGFSAAMRV